MGDAYMGKKLQFPPGFLWGVSTAAGQVEGGADEDGRGPSIWDTFAAQPGRIAGGATPAVTCDWYHRSEADLDLMQRLGVPNCRMSISWSRVIPEGEGSVNDKGLAYYDRLIDAALARGIQPCVTLYHWDLPAALQPSGGWANRATVEAFAKYTETVVRRLGDRVKHWVTINEPWSIAALGYLEGAHAPGMKDLPTALKVSHNLLLAHGRGAAVIHSLGSRGSEVGFAHPLEWVVPASPAEKDMQAANRRDGAVNRWFLDPVFRGAYPADMIEWYGASAPKVEPGDLETIAEPIDFLGVDYYTRTVIADAPNGDFLATRQVQYPFVPHAEIEVWEVNPEGLYRALMRLHREYDAPSLIITGNGTSLPDVPGADGAVHDPARIEFLRRHIAAAWQAIQDGASVRGYFIWSILDNFEWNLGFTKRFGLTYVDFETQERIPKDSALWYASVVREGAVTIET